MVSEPFLLNRESRFISIIFTQIIYRVYDLVYKIMEFDLVSALDLRLLRLIYIAQVQIYNIFFLEKFDLFNNFLEFLKYCSILDFKLNVL